MTTCPGCEQEVYADLLDDGDRLRCRSCGHADDAGAFQDPPLPEGRVLTDGGRPGPLRWRLSEGPPEHSLGGETDQEPEEIAADEFLDRVDPDRRTVADELAEQAAADPEADPLADVESRGGFSMGCDPEGSA